MPTDLYERIIERDESGKKPRLMRVVWEGTPWIVDVHTGCVNSERDRNIRLWCRERFGPECWPMHGKLGKWQRGGATVDGWTWYGFATKELMQQFCDKWGAETDAT